MKFKKFLTVMSALVLSCSVLPFSDGIQSKAVNSVTFSEFDKTVNNGEVIRGVDVSSIIAIENAGVKFYNDEGQEQDIFMTLAQHGVNYIRVRVWNEPYNSDGKSYGGGNSDVYTAGLIGARASKYNMKLLVDIQYSDFWADPEKQTPPKYWSTHSHEQKKTEIYKWTEWVLKSVTEAGGKIGMVQVGNETNGFFCGEKDMYSICDLFSSGEKAVRDFDKSILIAHHFADPSNTEYYNWYAKVMDECKLDYDVFATSYYPYWQGDTKNLTSVLKGIGDRYNKYVMVAETAYPYTSEDGDTFGNVVSKDSSNVNFRYDISVEGQANCIADVFQAVANCGKHGIGAFYWEPAWLGVPDKWWNEQKELWEKYGSGWATQYAGEYDSSVKESGGSSYDNQALFDFNGNPLESLKVFENIYPKNENIIPKQGTEIDEGMYRIKNVNSGLYLTVAEGEKKAGANVVQYTADGQADYNTWNLKKTGDGYYKIYSSMGDGSTYLLDLDYGRAENKTNIGIFTDTQSDAQQFKFITDKNGNYIITTKSTADRSAVEVADALSSDGANVQQFTLNGHSCQAWVLEPVQDYALAGDLNGDGKVNIFDFTLMRKNIVNSTENPASDLDSDGKTGVSDLILMQSYIIGKNTSFKWKERGTKNNTIFPHIK